MIKNNKLKFLHFNNDELFKHLNKNSKKLNQSRTLAALAISPNSIRKTISDFFTLENGVELLVPMTMGISLVSFVDNYSRQIGRETAIRKMKEIDVKVKSVKIDETHMYVNLEAFNGVELSLRLNRKTGFSSILGALVGPGN